MNALTHVPNQPMYAIVPASSVATLPQLTTLAPMPLASDAKTQIISIEEIVRCVLKRWKIATCVAATTAGLLLTMMLGRTPMFESSSSLLMQMQEAKVAGWDPVMNHSGEALTAPMLLNNHKVQLTSNKFFDFFYQQLPPLDRAAFIAKPEKPSLVSRIKGMILPKAADDRTQEQKDRATFQDLCEKATVDFIKETLILKITVRHHDSQVAATMANHWAKIYTEYVGKEGNEPTVQASEFLRAEAEKIRVQVEQSERKLAAYNDEKSLLDDEAQKAGTSEKLKVLASEQAKLEVELAKTNQALAQIKAASGSMEKLLSIDLLNQNPALATLRAKLTEQLNIKERLDARYGHKHHKVLQFNQEFESLLNEINLAIDRGIASLQSRSDSLDGQLKNIQTQMDEVTKANTQLGSENVEKNLIRSRLQADRALYDKVLARLHEATVSSRFNEVTHLRQSETAVPAKKATSPNKPISVILAGFSFAALFVTVPLVLAVIGVLRASGIQGLFDRLRGQTAATPAQVVPLTPSTPPSTEQGLQLVAGVPNKVDAPLWGSIHNIPSPHAGRPDLLLRSIFVSQTPTRTLLEGIAGNLCRAAAGQREIIAITSHVPGEGKSFAAASLGVALLAHGKTALIVDCHATHPSLHVFLPRVSIPGTTTLKDLRTWGTERIDDLAPQRCGTSNLYTLEAGHDGAIGDTIHSEPWFARLIRAVKTQVDFVILDCPSLLESTEVAPLLNLADRAVIIHNPGTVAEPQHQETLTRVATTFRHLAFSRIINNGPQVRATV